MQTLNHPIAGIHHVLVPSLGPVTPGAVACLNDPGKTSQPLKLLLQAVTLASDPPDKTTLLIVELLFHLAHLFTHFTALFWKATVPARSARCRPSQDIYRFGCWPR